MFKIKHERTADCVVAGYRVHKSGADAIGSLLLGLYQDDGQLASVGVIGAFPMAERRRLFTEMQPLVTSFEGHPWNWAAHEAGERTPRKNEFSRWNAGKDLSFVPLRPERVVEVRYDHMEGQRFRHTAQFNRWRPDRDPRSCTYEQLEQPVTFSLDDIVPGLGVLLSMEGVGRVRRRRVPRPGSASSLGSSAGIAHREQRLTGVSVGDLDCVTPFFGGDRVEQRPGFGVQPARRGPTLGAEGMQDAAETGMLRSCPARERQLRKRCADRRS